MDIPLSGRLTLYIQFTQSLRLPYVIVGNCFKNTPMSRFSYFHEKPAKLSDRFLHMQSLNAYPMKNPTEILTDIKGFRSDLRSLHENKHTCNQLRTYISRITHYMRINDVDLERSQPFLPLIEKEIEYIKPHIPYDITSQAAINLFRRTQHKVDATISKLISHIEHEITN